MTNAKLYSVRLSLCSLLLVFLSISSNGNGWGLDIGMLATTAAANPQASRIAPYCKYLPDWPLFQAGDEKVQHSTGHTGRPDEPGTTDGYDILLPRVNRPVTEYNSQANRIPLKRGDELVVAACGCVQTGGSGLTWKLYVNPSGPNSEDLYHGVILIPNAKELGLPTSPKFKYFVRISDLIAAQKNPNFHLIVTTQTYLTLGYEDGDSDYGDNGYSSHDDGKNGQCQNVGGATVSILITHH